MCSVLLVNLKFTLNAYSPTIFKENYAISDDHALVADEIIVDWVAGRDQVP